MMFSLINPRKSKMFLYGTTLSYHKLGNLIFKLNFQRHVLLYNDGKKFILIKQ